MATYLTLDPRYGITSFDPSNGYPVITLTSVLVDDADVIPILELADEQTPAVFILVSDHPLTGPGTAYTTPDYATVDDLNNALVGVVRVTPQTWTSDQQTVARTNLNAAEDTAIGAVRYDVVQSLTDTEKAQARDNIGAGTTGGGGGGTSSMALPGYISVYDSALSAVAVGDGVADDTAALNAAETYALANGYLGVDLSKGTYRITGPVNFSTGVRGAGGNESTECVIKCDSATAKVSWGYYQANPALDTVHARVATGFVIDMNGSGDPSPTSARFEVYNVKGIVLDVNVTDLSLSGTTVASCVAGNAVRFNGAQNVESIQLNSSAVQGTALLLDNGTGGCAFKNCHQTTAGTLLRVTDTSPGSSTGNGAGFPFGPFSNTFDSCIYETRLNDSVQLVSIECGSLQLFRSCQFSVSTSTAVLTSGAMVNVSGDIVFKGLLSPFSTHAAFGDGCSWNGGAKGASTGTNPVACVAINGLQFVDFSGVHYVQNATNLAYNLAGAGTARIAMSGLVTGGGYSGVRAGATSALSDAKQAIAVGTGVTGYTLTFASATTSSIGPSDTAASIQTKLQALSSIGAGNITVTGENGVYMAHFTGSKAGVAQATITSTPTGGTVTVTPVQTGGVAPSLNNYTNALNSLRLAGDFSRSVHYTPVTVAALVFNVDVSAYPEIQFSYVNSATNLTSLTLSNPTDGQVFTISHLQSNQGESSYVWPSNCVFRGPIPQERAASSFLSVTFRYYQAGNLWFEESRSGARQPDLPYYAGSLQHSYDPQTAAYNFNGSTLHKIRAKLAAAIAGTADFHVVFFGDSTLGGYQGASYAYDTCVPRSFARAIAARTGASWQQGIQYAIGDKTHTADNWSLTGGFGTGTALGTATIFLFCNGAGTATRNPLAGETGTAVDIYYSDLGTNGIAWTINGTSQTALATGATNTIRKTTVSGLTAGAKTIVISPAAGQNITIVGVRVYTPATKSVHVHNLSIGGSRANGGSNDLNWSSTSSSGVYGVGWVMPNLLTAAGVTPDLLVVSIGGNDIANGTDAPTTLTGLDTMFGYESSAPGIIVHAHKVSGVLDSTYNLLSKGKFERADSLNKAMFNWDDWVQGLATATADGLIGADGTHPTTTLQTMIGTQLGNLLTR